MKVACFQYITLAFLSIILFSSCDNKRVFEQNVKIPENSWSEKNIVKIDAEIADTVTPQSVFINVRNTGNYSYSNLYVFITTEGPDGKKLTDTVNCILTDDRGKWLGKGIGDLYYTVIPYKMNIRFPAAGKYKFAIQQGMRCEKLEDISDIGIRIQRAY